MSMPGRRMPAPYPTRSHHHSQDRLTRAVQNTGRLLCWSLATGMTTAATELLLAPAVGWWHTLWPLPWYLACLSVPAWAILRAREKGALGSPDENHLPARWEQAA